MEPYVQLFQATFWEQSTIMRSMLFQATTTAPRGILPLKFPTQLEWTAGLAIRAYMAA